MHTEVVRSLNQQIYANPNDYVKNKDLPNLVDNLQQKPNQLKPLNTLQQLESIQDLEDLEDLNRQEEKQEPPKKTKIRIHTIQNVDKDKRELNSALSSSDNIPYIYKTLGKLIRKLRIENYYSQDQLAQYIGVQRHAIVCIEKGKRKVDIIEYFKLMFLLDREFPKDPTSNIIIRHLTSLTQEDIDHYTEKHKPKFKPRF